jgi:SAM-dependent methyltransferase
MVTLSVMSSPYPYYDTHLGPRYAWMTGDFAALCTRAAADLAAAGLDLTRSGRALDLGAGRGQYVVILARAGWTVLDLEACAPLHAELATHVAGLGAKTAPVEWSAWLSAAPSLPAWDLMLCVGDTLCHLPDVATLHSTLAAALARLAPGGKLVLTFRDYSRAADTDQVRIIPVRSDAERILTCVLQYQAAHVQVHDLFHERQANGEWTLHAAAYSKLRLAPADLAARLTALGAQVTPFVPGGGMVGLVATPHSSPA